MGKRIESEMPVGRLVRVKDFLPPPSELAAPRDEVKVTLALSRRSIAFFKAQARRNHTKYQRMIRELVDRYASHYLTK
ncbi:MAG: CopG family transcriptional regulator [Nitrospirae bacterium]|nr:CopG family transcriptional regulator [Nitrospirota bacterium]